MKKTVRWLTEEKRGPVRGLSTFALHILGCLFMLLDHLWITLVSDNNWMTCVGRLAFPLFAFLLVEGFFHTSDRKKYGLRLLILALVSEVPFDLVMSGEAFEPFYQNVIWNLLLSFLLMALSERVKAMERKTWLKGPLFVLIWGAGGALALVTLTDYYCFGVWTVLIFYVFRKRTPLNLFLQLLGLYLINVVLIGGMSLPVTLFGHEFFVPIQSFACLSLLLIRAYSGKPGPKGKWVRAFNYGFYPLHLLILAAFMLLAG